MAPQAYCAIERERERERESERERERERGPWLLRHTVPYTYSEAHAVKAYKFQVARSMMQSEW